MFVHNCGATLSAEITFLNIEKFNLNNRTTQQNSFPFPHKINDLVKYCNSKNGKMISQTNNNKNKNNYYYYYIRVSKR